MAIFIIFASIVLISLILQWLSKRWLIATGVPCALFTVLVLSGALFPRHVFLAFVLGMPMIFFASLLGSYLYETRFNPDRHDNQHDIDAVDHDNNEQNEQNDINQDIVDQNTAEKSSEKNDKFKP